jgi:hypothetical protein
MAEGDYFLIETPGGTQLLNFANFVIDQDNTTFAADLQTNVTTLSTTMETVSAATDLNNVDSTMSIINTSLTQSIDSLTDTLFGTAMLLDPTITFEGALQAKRDGASVDPITQEARDLGSHLQALSAMVFDSLWSKLASLSGNLLGDGGTDTDPFPVTEFPGFYINNKLNPVEHPGGLLGAVLNTAQRSNETEVYRLPTNNFTSGVTNMEVKASMNQEFNIDVNSLSFNLKYNNIPVESARKTGDCPYANPGQFVITDFVSSTSGTDTEYTWTVTRIGGSNWTEDDGSFSIGIVGTVVGVR